MPLLPDFTMYPTRLEESIRYTFKNRALLTEALTHSSWFNEKKELRTSENEKFEYLGDAILNSVIAILLYKKYKDRDEGFLSNARSILVKRDTLTQIAQTIHLERFISYGNGDTLVPPASKVFSNMFEALIGAIYLDGGIRQATKVVRYLFKSYFNERQLNEKNPKNTLQELSQKKWGILPKYKFTRKVRDGFTVVVYVDKELKAKGTGKNKKEAQQNAAQNLLNIINE